MSLIRKIKDIPLKIKVFVCYTLIIIIALISFAVFSSNAFIHTLTLRSQKSSTRELELINFSLDTLISSIEDYSRVIASENRLQKEISAYRRTVESGYAQLTNVKIRSAMSEILSNIISPNTQIAGVAVFVDKNVIYAGYSLSDEAVYDIISKEHLNLALEKQRPVWTNHLAPLKFLDNRTYNVFAVSKLIRDRNTGEALGTVTLFVNETNFANLYTKNLINDEDKYYIADPSGKVLSSRSKSDLYQNISQVLQIDAKEYANLEKTGTLLYTKEKYPILFSLKEYGKFGWKVVSVTTLYELVQEKERIQSMIVLIALIFASLVFISSFYISFTVTKPIYGLLDTMTRIRQGNTQIRAQEDTGGEVGILSSGFNHLMDQLEESMQQIYREEQSRHENELKLLQAQIKPHFLYNTMETVSSFIKLDMKEHALTALQYISNFYRISLSRGSEMIPLGEEIKIIENYLKIQCLRYAEYLDYTLEVQEDILTYFIPKLTIQPLVENAIYHGIKQSPNKGTIMIRGYSKEEDIVIEVLDTGIGISHERLAQITQAIQSKKVDARHFGLCNVDERIKLVYGEKYGISIESIEGEYTQVTIHIPLHQIKADGENNENTHS